MPDAGTTAAILADIARRKAQNPLAQLLDRGVNAYQGAAETKAARTLQRMIAERQAGLAEQRNATNERAIGVQERGQEFNQQQALRQSMAQQEDASSLNAYLQSRQRAQANPQSGPARAPTGLQTPQAVRTLTNMMGQDQARQDSLRREGKSDASEAARRSEAAERARISGEYLRIAEEKARRDAQGGMTNEEREEWDVKMEGYRLRNKRYEKELEGIDSLIARRAAQTKKEEAIEARRALLDPKEKLAMDKAAWEKAARDNPDLFGFDSIQRAQSDPAFREAQKAAAVDAYEELLRGTTKDPNATAPFSVDENTYDSIKAQFDQNPYSFTYEQLEAIAEYERKLRTK